MKINYKTVSTFLILVLVGLLTWIFISYYNTPARVTTTNHREISIINNIEESGEKVASNKNNVTPTDIIATLDSGDNKIKEDNPIIKDIENNDSKVVETTRKDTKAENDKNNKNNQVIITSEDTMTNKEKREILTELDNTLMELLDVVDKVQTVDETRLITDESEVQK